MILSKIKEIVSGNCSSEQKIKQIKDLLNHPEIKGDESPYFDLVIEKENIVKFKQYIPEGKQVRQIEILSVSRLATSSGNLTPHVVNFVPLGEMVFPRPNNDHVVRKYCLAQYGDATIEFTAIIGFNLKAIRFKIDWDQPVIPGTMDLPPFPTFKIRIHLEDK